MQAAYPADTDLKSFVQAAGFDLSIYTGLDFVSGIAAGIQRFERETGRTMFLKATSTPVARTFDPPTNYTSVLDLKADLIQLTSVTLVGVAQVQGTDFRLLPQDAPAEGKPWTRIQMANRFYKPLWPNMWGSLTVTGIWAYSTAGIADDAWRGMLAAGALELLPQLTTGIAQGMTDYVEADLREGWGPEPQAALRKSWERIYERAAGRWRKVEVGVMGGP